MEVFRGECNFSQSSGVRRKGKSSTWGARIFIAIALLYYDICCRDMLKDELRKLLWLSCKELSVYANLEPMIICKLN